LPTADELRAVIAGQRAAVHGLRTAARVHLESPEGSGSAQQVLVASRPDRLRVEVLSPFGSVFVLATSGGQLAAYVREENRVYRGRATAANLAHYAQIELSVSDLVDLLLGLPPQRQEGFGAVFVDAAAQIVRLRQQTPEGAQVVAFTGDPLRPVAVEERGADDHLAWGAAFDRHAFVDGVWLPLWVSLWQPAQQRRITMTFDEPELNPELPASVFTLDAPPGSEEVRLEVVARGRGQ
jgi:hypothetical protein